MEYLGIPLRPEERRLNRVGLPTALEELFRAMAVTPAGRWPGGDHFGLYDFLTGIPMREREARDEAQRVLEELGVTGLTIRRIVAVSAKRKGGDRQFRIEVAGPGDQTQTFLVELHQ